MRKRSVAALGSAVFLVLVPGTVLGLIPWLISRWEFSAPMPSWAPLPVQVLGAALLALGVAELLYAFGSFAMEGFGTPAPNAPPQRLVVGGLYRFVRNPMYVAVVWGIVGQGLLLGHWGVLLYGVIAWSISAAWVRWREEPILARRFGAEYETYRKAVRAWWPRIRPWNPSVLGSDRVTVERSPFG